MSRLVFLTFGTYGDVAPYVGLGAALSAAGHDVAVAAQKPYEPLITGAGLQFRFLPKDTERATRESPNAQAMIDGERMRPSRGMTRELVEQMDGVGPAMVTASEGADLLLACGPVGSMFGYHIAAAMGISSFGLQLQPLARTADFAPPVLTLRSFGRLGNKAVWKLAGLGEKIYLRVGGGDAILTQAGWRDRSRQPSAIGDTGTDRRNCRSPCAPRTESPPPRPCWSGSSISFHDHESRGVDRGDNRRTGVEHRVSHDHVGVVPAIGGLIAT